MGLLKNTHEDYYKGNDYGNYQFTSLEDIINQFMVVYVGDNKMIPSASRMDVAFHAQRALAELSFDTLKSVKAYEIELPPSLQMILPHDYVNYTKISSVDSAGIKHPLYPTKHTSNPFEIRQEENGDYTFVELAEEIVNGTFDTDVDNSSSIDAWVKSQFNAHFNYPTSGVSEKLGEIAVESSKLVFKHRSLLSTPGSNVFSTSSYVFQPIDVSDKEFITLSADGQAVDTTISTTIQPGVLKVGISTKQPQSNTNYCSAGPASNNQSFLPNIDNSMWDLTDEDGNPSYLEWTVAGDNTTSKSIEFIDVRNENVVYVIVLSRHDFTAETTTFVTTNNIDNISVVASNANTKLVSPATNGKNVSTTWNNYKSHTPSENNTNDYQDYQNDIYWPNEGKRYGLDPQHAQVNGSFYIDQRLGKIHFSSNISGKTVILDYISDSLGTDSEMQVHKFAEEAMYKSISHAILSGSSYGQALVPRLTKEKFAAIRKAKLRLSDIKLEELTQILRGKSKQIKH